MPDFEIPLLAPVAVTAPGFYRAVIIKGGAACQLDRCAEQAPGHGRFPLKAGEVIVAARFRTDGGEPYRSGQAVGLLSTRSARTQAAGSHTDKQGRPLVRRTADGHLIAIADPDLADKNGVPWNLIYVACIFSDEEDVCETCRPHRGPWIDPTPRGVWLLTDADVAQWPRLDVLTYSVDWYQQQLDELKRADRASRRTYGEMSAKLGAARAELARAHERIRELGAAAVSNPKPCKHLRTQSDSAGQWHCSGCGDIVPVGTVGDLVDRLAQFGGYSRAEIAELRRARPLSEPKRDPTFDVGFYDGTTWPPPPTSRLVTAATEAMGEAMGEPKSGGGCRLVDSTWVHNGEPHSCPAYVRGKR